MKQIQSLFSSFAGIDPASTDETTRKDFASEVLWERVLPFPVMEKHLLGIARDAFKKTHLGVRCGTGELLLIDTGGADITQQALPLPF